MAAIVVTAIVTILLDLALRQRRVEGPLKLVCLFLAAALSFLVVTALTSDETSADLWFFAAIIVVIGVFLALRLRSPPVPPARRTRDRTPPANDTPEP